MKRSLKTAICFALILVTLTFAGCETQIDLYEQQDDEKYYFALDVKLPGRVVDSLEASSSYNQKTNARYKLSEWLCDYFDFISEMYVFDYMYEGVSLGENDKRIYRFSITVNKDEDRALKDALTLSGETDINTDMFIRTISVVRDDRFNYFIKEFDTAYDCYTGEGGKLNVAQSITGALLYGGLKVYPQYASDPASALAAYPELKYSVDIGVYEITFPGIFEAFPAVNLSDYKNIVLRNFWYASKKMKVVADAVAYPSGDSRGVYYVFEKTVNDGDTKVEYEYYRADPTGWYIVAILCGGVAVGICFLIAYINKKKKNRAPKLTVKDSFPYDPFADYNTGSGDDNNPFDGY